MTRFLLIRHGMTDAVGRYHSGRAPGVLMTDEGREQVRRTAETLRGTSITAIVSSPLERTRDTATIIADALGLPVAFDERLIEYDVGAWTGRTFESLSTDRDWMAFNLARSMNRAPSGERMIDVQQRATAALFDLRSMHGDASIAVVTHADVIRAVLLYCLGMPIDFYHRLDIGPARISIVDINEDAAIVRQINGDTASLLR